MKTLSLIFLGITLIQPLSADWKESFNNAWDDTKDISSDTLDKTKELYSSLSGDVTLVNGAKPISHDIIINENTEHLKQIWPDVLDNLSKALDLNKKIDKAPDSSWLSADKKSLLEDQYDVFADIEALLDSPAISKNRENIDRLKNKIGEERKHIAKLKEERIVATEKEKNKLDSNIKDSRDKINAYFDNINYQKSNLKLRLQKMGLLLDSEQIDVLLSRVDSDDIIKMSIVFDVLADITKQLMELTQEFNEDINQARKYYGMHVVLLKLVINMQQSYINKLDNEYLPKIANIQSQTEKVNQESRSLLRSEKNSTQHRVLRNNIQAQQLTLKVARLYAQQLNKQKEKINEALVQAKIDYLIAKNTFDTVKLSAELIRLMKTNQASFNALMSIQIPEIVPFKNSEMQKKFEELSLMLKE